MRRNPSAISSWTPAPARPRLQTFPGAFPARCGNLTPGESLTFEVFVADATATRVAARTSRALHVGLIRSVLGACESTHIGLARIHDDGSHEGNEVRETEVAR